MRLAENRHCACARGFKQFSVFAECRAQTRQFESHCGGDTGRKRIQQLLFTSSNVNYFLLFTIPLRLTVEFLQTRCCFVATQWRRCQRWLSCPHQLSRRLRPRHFRNQRNCSLPKERIQLYSALGLGPFHPECTAATSKGERRAVCGACTLWLVFNCHGEPFLLELSRIACLCSILQIRGKIGPFFERVEYFMPETGRQCKPRASKQKWCSRRLAGLAANAEADANCALAFALLCLHSACAASSSVKGGQHCCRYQVTSFAALAAVIVFDKSSLQRRCRHTRLRFGSSETGLQHCLPRTISQPIARTDSFGTWNRCGPL